MGALGASVTWLAAPADVTTLSTAARAVLFIYVNWSAQATAGWKMVEHAAWRWANERPDWPVSWLAVDFSQGISAHAAIADWLAAQQPLIGVPAGQLINTGAGPLIWIEQGKVVAFTPAVFQYGVDELLQRTAAAFRISHSL